MFSMWLIYALGGGWGHLTRAVALARAVGGQAPVRIVTNCPYADFIRRCVPEIDVRTVVSREETISALAGCECLIVDTFPRGLLGELADSVRRPAFRKVLVARDLNPEYVESFALRSFVAEHYDLILLPGEGEAFADLPCAQLTDPWLAAPVPALEAHRSTALICASGNPDEQAWYGEVAALLGEEMPVRCVSPTCPAGCPPALWQAHWPALDLFGRAAVVVGGAGYNTVYETRAAGVPLIARCWPRLYDRQGLRAARAGATVVTTPREAVEAARRLRCCDTTKNVARNGAVQAVALIREL